MCSTTNKKTQNTRKHLGAQTLGRESGFLGLLWLRQRLVARPIRDSDYGVKNPAVVGAHGAALQDIGRHMLGQQAQFQLETRLKCKRSRWQDANQPSSSARQVPPDRVKPHARDRFQARGAEDVLLDPVVFFLDKRVITSNSNLP